MKKEDVGFIKTPQGIETYCKKCHGEVYWQECDQCEDGYSYHDCGEDACCCVEPLPNVDCDVCDGEGGWYVCLDCDVKVTFVMGEYGVK